MAFLDELTLNVKAGNGGNGVVRWRREKGKPLMGPGGGNGGRGGDVYARALRNLHTLSLYAQKLDFDADAGGDGGKNGIHGENGEDLVLDFPVGTILKNTLTGEEHSLESEGDSVLLLRGGYGGKGNEHFKSSTNRSPKEATLGGEGGQATFFVELRLFADVGLVGLPNAGKSSLLNALTKAKAKVAEYAFTTLEPNLGDFHGYIIADIPGLIEGAAEGKGLGHKFLKHIQRTKILLHLISLENKNITETYTNIRNELKAYGGDLLKKKEILLLTKTDLIDGKELKKKITEAKKLNKNVFTITLYDDVSIKDFADAFSIELKGGA